MKTFVPTVLLATSTAMLAAAESVEVNATMPQPSPRAVSEWFSYDLQLGGTNLTNHSGVMAYDEFDCLRKCEEVEGCFGVNYQYGVREWTLGPCIFKGHDTLYAPGKPSTNGDFASGMLVPLDFPTPRPYYKFFDNCDIAGGDVGNHPGTDVHDCAKQCDKKVKGYNDPDGCTTVTWSNYNGGTCWFKYYSLLPCTDKEGVSTAFLFMSYSTLPSA